MNQRTTADLEDGLEAIREAPHDDGRVDRIVRRPAVGEREILEECVLDVDRGLVGDTWSDRPSRKMPDEQPHPDMQLTLMNSRCAALLAGGPDGWEMAGDQLYVDLDLGLDNLPPGTRLLIGSAVIEVTAEPHTGCAKFAERFGKDAMRFVNSPDGRALRLRGMNTRVVTGGSICAGDRIRKVSS